MKQRALGSSPGMGNSIEAVLLSKHPQSKAPNPQMDRQRMSVHMCSPFTRTVTINHAGCPSFLWPQGGAVSPSDHQFKLDVTSFQKRTDQMSQWCLFIFLTKGEKTKR